MKVKVGDNVKVLTGKDKGKEGKVLYTLRKKDRVVVEGVNIVKKHMKPSRMNETGGILEVENPIHVSNVKVLTAKENKKTKEVKEVKTEKKATKKKGTGDK
ncbi:MAG: 50S ribosomal protein L24 [Tenericutes bacterium]|nr:50S ribosomal protein L24 [Mycoplasmatota bacterium]